MSGLFSNAIAIQSAKRTDRLNAISINEPQTLIAQPNGFDSATGQYIAVTADGSEVPYMAGNFTAQTGQISIIKPSQGLISFGDWK